MAEPFPIVFFPGVMGSRLFFENSGKYWDPDSTWHMLHWAPVWPIRSDDDNRRELHAREPAGVLMDPLDNSVSAYGIEHGWGGVVWSYYGAYLNSLRAPDSPPEVFAVGYDWRQDIVWLGEYAADKLRTCLAATGAEKLRVVAHSMGGLVVRSAIRHDPTLAGQLDKVLYVCQPSTGSVMLYRRLFTGMVSGLDGNSSVADRATRFILGDSRAGFVGNMSGLPGPLQLLPSGFFPSDADGRQWNDALDNGTTFANLYNNAASPPGIADPSLQLPAEARADFAQRILDLTAFHTWLGSPTDTTLPSLNAWLIYGIGQKTETRIGFTNGKPVPNVTPDGDGTVPRLSATALGLAPDRQFSVENLEHATAFQRAEVGALSSQIL